MRLRRTLTALALVSFIALAVAGCLTPRTQSPAESTVDKDRDGVRDDVLANNTTVQDDNVTGPTPVYDPDVGGVGP